MFSSIKSANVFGEAIRDMAFVKKSEDDFGCYDTFELEKEFLEIAKGSATWNNMTHALGNLEPEELETVKVYTNGLIDITWWWDGDGTLVVSDGERMARNTDCKKDYGWEWI